MVTEDTVLKALDKPRKLYTILRAISCVHRVVELAHHLSQISNTVMTCV